MEWTKRTVFTDFSQYKLELVRSGSSVLDLSMLNPDLAPPRLLVDRLLEFSVKPANHRYAVSRGIARLRAAFACKYEQAFGVRLDPDSDICVTFGTKDALPNALTCLKQLGYDKTVLLQAPCYPGHVSAVQLAGLNYGMYELSRDADRVLAGIDAQLSSGRFSIILMNLPSNPEGIYFDRDFFERLLELAGRHKVFVLNDFVYGEMSFGRPAPSLLSFNDPHLPAAETYSLSKVYSIPGWRVGALLGNRRLIGLLSELKSQLDYGIFLPIQLAAAAALTSGPELQAPIVGEYRKRCSLLVAGLQALGWQTCMPEAGASVWARVPAPLSAEAVRREGGPLAATRYISEQIGVLAMPGAVYGTPFFDWIRFAMVISAEAIRDVLSRLEELNNRLGVANGLSAREIA